MRTILLIFSKEWLEIRLQRGLLLSILLPPLFFALVPVVLVIVAGKFPALTMSTNTLSLLPIPALSHLSREEMGQALVGLQFSILYLILPVIIPGIIASYSIVGEKNNGTLEPLLATPIKTWQLLVGKCVAAVLPALLVTWVCGLCFVVAFLTLALDSRVVDMVITPGWLIALFLWTPFLALLSVAVITAVSSRVNDPRTAQQFSSWFVVPFLLVFFGQMFGIIVLGVFFALVALLVLIMITFLAFWAVTWLFQREVILTRWK